MEPDREEAERDGAGDAQGPQAAAAVANARAAVVSGTSDDESSDDGNGSVPAYNHPDELFDENADDDNEAYVYRYMRGGTEEEVRVRRAAAASRDAPARARDSSDDGGASGSTVAPPMGPTSASAAASQKASASALEQAKMLKPRSSDAVLSCPCCFSIVCMDCQRHERYKNQWRAMFVMNIGVDWNRNLIYDEGRRELVERVPHPPAAGTGTGGGVTEIPRDDPTEDEAEEFYYPVFCDNCKTEVAALNMDDEMYHFYGCIASA